MGKHRQEIIERMTAKGMKQADIELLLDTGHAAADNAIKAFLATFSTMENAALKALTMSLSARFLVDKITSALAAMADDDDDEDLESVH